MANGSEKGRKSEAEIQDFVVVTLVRDLEQAKDYEALLKNNEIPAVIKRHDEESTDAAAIAIMVPEEFIDEAHVVIESQDSYDDFYDLALEEEGDDNFDSDLFADEF